MRMIENSKLDTLPGPGNSKLLERRRWFSFFPEGTLEFLVVTRVLALLLMGTLIIVPSTQRPAVLVALAAVVWADYALLTWWLVHVSADLHDLFAASATIGDRRRQPY